MPLPKPPKRPGIDPDDDALPVMQPGPLPTLNPDGSADVPLDEEEIGDIVEHEDGSATIDLLHDEPTPVESGFHENMAETLDGGLLSELASTVIEQVARDRGAREQRDKDYAEGIRRTGLGNEAPGGAEFDGASRAVHPALVEGCIDFSARAMKEAFPADGPVKIRIIGEQTKTKIAKAERKRQYMNWQCTTQIAEYRRELEVLLTQLPLGGSQYMKGYWDPRWERQRWEFVPIDDLLLPFEATSLETASRKTHVIRLNKAQMEERIESGLYIEIDTSAGQTVDRTEAGQATDKIEGVDDQGYNEDGLRVLYEQQVLLTLPDGADAHAKRSVMPYILTVDESTNKTIGLRRNWSEQDQDKCEPLPWIVEFAFIPWRGAYAIGLAHIIGSMAGALTGGVRALLDSALISNMPGMLKLKGARVSGQNVTIQPTEITEIEGGVGVDDIRKLAMAIPYNPPSTVLFQLVQWLSEQTKGVVGTAEERIADAKSNMPVGTALALIEQGSITFSSIHARLHNSQKQVLAIMHRLNAQYLKDEETVEELGELVVSRQDFQGPMDLEPVSDPNIFSDAQRYAQLQAVLSLAAQPAMAPMFKMQQLAKRSLRLLKFPAPDEVLAVPEDAEELDPIAENVAAADPLKTLKAYEGQDHMRHLKCHVAFMSSPIFAANQMMGIPTLPALIQHSREHLLMFYQEHAQGAMQAKQALLKAGSAGIEGIDDFALADHELSKELGPIMDHLMGAAKMAQDMAPKPPQDPSLQIAGMKQQVDSQKLQADAQKAQSDAQLEGQRLQGEREKAAAEAQMEQLRIQMEQQATQAAQALETWQTRVEMGTSQRNAEMAKQLADRDRELQLALSELGGAQAKELAALQGRLDLILLEQEQRGDMVKAAQAARDNQRLESFKTPAFKPGSSGAKK